MRFKYTQIKVINTIMQSLPLPEKRTFEEYKEMIKRLDRLK